MKGRIIGFIAVVTALVGVLVPLVVRRKQVAAALEVRGSQYAYDFSNPTPLYGE